MRFVFRISTQRFIYKYFRRRVPEPYGTLSGRIPGQHDRDRRTGGISAVHTGEPAEQGKDTRPSDIIPTEYVRQRTVASEPGDGMAAVYRMFQTSSAEVNSSGNTGLQSDNYMIEQTFDDYKDSQPFNIYYLTISGHLPYGFSSSQMASRNREAVEDLPYSETTKALSRPIWNWKKD